VRAPLRPLYAATVALARGLAAASGESNTSGSKLWRSVHARRGIIARWRAQAAAARDTRRPLIWLHAPSVGEGLQARPVAHALRHALPEAQQAYSFFSPSAERFAASVGADFTDYLPFDSAADADALLDALQPSVLVFVKLDVWPILVERATRRGIPVMMLSATLAEGSGRRGTVSRALLRDAYAAMTAVGVIDASHGARLVDLGVNASCIHHTGDTRFDQVWERAQRVDRTGPLLRATACTRPTLVAGSTWPVDEAVLLPAWESLRESVPSARIIIAPHEPTSAHLAPLTAWAERASLRCAMLGQVERGERHTDETDVLIVDRVGVLGDLYAHATAAFVGGGFHKAGLHSAIEPAAFGAPVLFGPGHHMSREAGLLLAAGAARSFATAKALMNALCGWLGTDQQAQAARVQAGDAARAVVQQELGATERSAALVREVLAART
jgi:3-deoxy-D-manno-octulosonic-acid transferase